MTEKKKRIVIALGGNALGNTLHEQMLAVKTTAKAIVDLIQEGCEVIVAHGNGPQVGMINHAMAALSREDPNQPNTPLSVCVAMSQAYIGYDLQNALREEMYNRDIFDIPVATMVTQVRVDPEDPAFKNPSKPIGHFMTKEQAEYAAKEYGYIVKEDAGRGSAASSPRRCPRKSLKSAPSRPSSIPASWSSPAVAAASPSCATATTSKGPAPSSTRISPANAWPKTSTPTTSSS